MSFSDLGLSAKVLAAVDASGYVEPTPIQAQAIPHVLARRDVLGIAQTGTGKTASFVLPMLTMLEKGRARARMPRTLILEPTRELAAQVAESFDRYGVNNKLTMALLIGGVSFDEQNKKLDRGVDVLIATPGRLLDHIERGKLLMNGVEILVIDEADRMLDMGFIPDIERISKLVPFTRQTLFFSATMPGEIQRLADNFLSNPVRVEVARPASTVDAVTQRFVRSDREPAVKRRHLRDLIRSTDDEVKNAIIFCNRKRDAAVLARSMIRHGFSAGALHGDMDQRARMAMLASFREGKTSFLVASDVAARGLDIPAVSHVFNFDVPTHAEDYVHRIGRTGRAGRSGTAITIVTPSEQKYVVAIEQLTGKQAVWSDPPGTDGSQDSAPAEAEAETGETKPASSDRRRTRSRGRRKDGGSETPAKSRTRAPQSTAKADEGAKPQPSGKGRGRSRKEDSEPVVGLGDHVPDFLLRPVRVPSSS